MDYDILRPLTLEALRSMVSNNNIQPLIIINAVDNVANRKGVPLGSEDKDKVIHIMNEFIIEGILGWGLNYANPAPPFMCITPYGRQVLEGIQTKPHDPDGYLNYLRTEIQNLDQIILTYVIEALETFRRNNLLASAVMLGVASERAFDLLLDALANAISNTNERKRFKDLQDNRKTKYKFEQVKKKIISIRRNLPSDISEDLESQLDGIFNLIRVTRNDVGHPTGKTVSRFQVLAILQLFIPYCKRVYGLINYLQNNRI